MFDVFSCLAVPIQFFLLNNQIDLSFFCRRSNARQSTLSSHEKKELRLAVMLMVVVLVS